MEPAAFECQRGTVRISRKPVTLSKSYLLDFGTFRIPEQLWQTLGQYACWLEAASSLPRLVDGEPGLEEIYTAMLLQRARLKSDQQLVEWSAQ